MSFSPAPRLLCAAALWLALWSVCAPTPALSFEVEKNLKSRCNPFPQEKGINQMLESNSMKAQDKDFKNNLGWSYEYQGDVLCCTKKADDSVEKLDSTAVGLCQKAFVKCFVVAYDDYHYVKFHQEQAQEDRILYYDLYEIVALGAAKAPNLQKCDLTVISTHGTANENVDLANKNLDMLRTYDLPGKDFNIKNVKNFAWSDGNQVKKLKNEIEKGGGLPSVNVARVQGTDLAQYRDHSESKKKLQFPKTFYVDQSLKILVPDGARGYRFDWIELIKVLKLDQRPGSIVAFAVCNGGETANFKKKPSDLAQIVKLRLNTVIDRSNFLNFERDVIVAYTPSPRTTLGQFEIDISNCSTLKCAEELIVNHNMVLRGFKGYFQQQHRDNSGLTE